MVYYAVHAMRDTAGCRARMQRDEEIIEGIKLLAECEGIFAENRRRRGRFACAKKLVASGKLDPKESTVLCITGHGLEDRRKPSADHCGAPRLINPSLREFEALVRDEVFRRRLNAQTSRRMARTRIRRTRVLLLKLLGPLFYYHRFLLPRF